MSVIMVNFDLVLTVEPESARKAYKLWNVFNPFGSDSAARI